MPAILIFRQGAAPYRAPRAAKRPTQDYDAGLVVQQHQLLCRSNSMGYPVTGP